MHCCIKREGKRGWRAWELIFISVPVSAQLHVFFYCNLETNISNCWLSADACLLVTFEPDFICCYMFLYQSVLFDWFPFLFPYRDFEPLWLWYFWYLRLQNVTIRQQHRLVDSYPSLNETVFSFELMWMWFWIFFILRFRLK